MLDAICELTLEARDIAALERFNREAFGLRVLAREDDRVWLGVGRRTRPSLWTPGPKAFDDRSGRHVHFARSADAGTLGALTKWLGRIGASVRGPVEHSGGDRSVCPSDPEGNVVEVWDFFDDGDGRRDGVAALADGSSALLHRGPTSRP